MTPDSMLMLTQIVTQVAAVLIAGGVIAMSRGLAAMNVKVGVLTERVEGIRSDLDLIRANYVPKHEHDHDLAEIVKRHETMSAHFYTLREQHMTCRPCADARASLPKGS